MDNTAKKVAVIMGSDSDLPAVKPAIDKLNILRRTGGGPRHERPPHPGATLR